jgi:GNAT superfamily N-acetyltransferase
MKRVAGEYEIDDAIERIDFAAVHGWLSGSYWSPGISREKVERAARHSSLVIGVYRDDAHVAYARVISDCATFGWLADVFVDEEHRGRGLAKEIVRFALTHPEHQGFRRWMLATRDAHGVYAEVGFEPMDKPELLMIHRPIPSWETAGG